MGKTKRKERLSKADAKPHVGKQAIDEVGSTQVTVNPTYRRATLGKLSSWEKKVGMEKKSASGNSRAKNEQEWVL